MLQLYTGASHRKRKPNRDVAAVEPIAVPPAIAADLLSVSRAQIYKLLREGRIDSYLVGRARRLLVASLRQYAVSLVAEQRGQPLSGYGSMAAAARATERRRREGEQPAKEVTR